MTTRQPCSCTSAPQCRRKRRLSAPFDALRDAADAFTARTGAPPRVYLAALGELATHSARTTWMRNFLAAGGIEAVCAAAHAKQPKARILLLGILTRKDEKPPRPSVTEKVNRILIERLAGKLGQLNN